MSMHRRVCVWGPETPYAASILQGHRSISPTMSRTSVNAALSFSLLSTWFLVPSLLAIDFPPVLPYFAFSSLLCVSQYQHETRMTRRTSIFSRETMALLSNNAVSPVTPISSALGSASGTIPKLLRFGSRPFSSSGRPRCSEL